MNQVLNRIFNQKPVEEVPAREQIDRPEGDNNPPETSESGPVTEQPVFEPLEDDGNTQAQAPTDLLEAPAHLPPSTRKYVRKDYRDDHLNTDRVLRSRENKQSENSATILNLNSKSNCLRCETYDLYLKLTMSSITSDILTNVEKGIIFEDRETPGGERNKTKTTSTGTKNDNVARQNTTASRQYKSETSVEQGTVEPVLRTS